MTSSSAGSRYPTRTRSQTTAWVHPDAEEVFARWEREGKEGVDSDEEEDGEVLGSSDTDESEDEDGAAKMEDLSQERWRELQKEASLQHHFIFFVSVGACLQSEAMWQSFEQAISHLKEGEHLHLKVQCTPSCVICDVDNRLMLSCACCRWCHTRPGSTFNRSFVRILVATVLSGPGD